jgi:hypothetical protein
LNKILPLRVLKAVAAWIWLELREGWRTWFLNPRVSEQRPLHPTPAEHAREKRSVATV